jgi:hypothetical protein
VIGPNGAGKTTLRASVGLVPGCGGFVQRNGPAVEPPSAPVMLVTAAFNVRARLGRASCAELRRVRRAGALPAGGGCRARRRDFSGGEMRQRSRRVVRQPGALLDEPSTTRRGYTGGAHARSALGAARPAPRSPGPRSRPALGLAERIAVLVAGRLVQRTRERYASSGDARAARLVGMAICSAAG